METKGCPARTSSEIPSIKLISLHFEHSRRRSVRRHNKHVIRSVRRRRRLKILTLGVIR